MKVYNEPHSNLEPEIKKTLDYLKKARNFNTKEYIENKSFVLNSYLKKFNLNACVIAISGGVDSALVLNLVSYASKQDNSPIKKIVALTLPNFENNSATNQADSVKKAQDLMTSTGIEIKTINISNIHQTIHNSVSDAIGQSDSWASGQLTAYARTPILYFATSTLTAQGFNPVLIGTTNRDEGAYLGYVGKASDGMVDIQLISDLHKSEVFQVSKYLNVPQSIMSATPSGDMFDGRTDEEVFGAPYDFVELYLNYLDCSQQTWLDLTTAWKEKDFEQFKKYQTAIENLHSYNKHKYLIGSPAVHLDILKSSVKNGWIEHIHSTPHKTNTHKVIPTHKFIGFTDDFPIISSNDIKSLNSTKIDHITKIENLFSNKDILGIKNYYQKNQHKLTQTNYNGLPSKNEQGSLRLSFYSEEFSKVLYERLTLINPELSRTINLNFETIMADTDNCPIWRPIGINPMFRVLAYQENSFLIPHYDDSFIPNNIQRSLKTIIIGIQEADEGGETQFLIDPQSLLSYSEKDLKDQKSLSKDILNSIKLKAGEALIFDHVRLHQGNTITKGLKIILRSEIMYEKCLP